MRIWIFAVWRSGSLALMRSPKAMRHRIRLDPASDMASGPALPERPTEVASRGQGFVSADCGRAVLFPRPIVFADRDDRRSLAVDDGVKAAASVIGAIGGHCVDLFTLGDLIEQFWQDRDVTIATGINSTARMSEMAASTARCTLRET